MDSFKKHSSRIKRNKLAPSSLLSRRLLLRKNPYVGSFRHAPPTTWNSLKASVLLCPPQRLPLTPRFYSQKTYKYLLAQKQSAIRRRMRNSPYVGWFRHAPSQPSPVQHRSRSHYVQQQHRQQKIQRITPRCHLYKMDHRQSIAMIEQCHALAKMLSKCHIPLHVRPHGDLSKKIVSGYLRGGGRDDDLDFTRNGMVPELDRSARTLLAKFGTWFLNNNPLSHDAEAFYRACDYDRKLKLLTEATMDEGYDDSDGDVSLYSDDGNSFDGIDSHDSDIDDGHGYDSDESSAALSDFDGPLLRPVVSAPQPPQMEISVSEIAEAYYAHQELDQRDLPATSSMLGGNEDRLDYVITQADIARMARNAARHLDVESILSLPTVTYCLQSHSTKGKSVKNTRDLRNQEEAFSFIMIPEQFSRSTVDFSNGASHIDDSGCVICLEAFQDGDRLRVLPCNHSFHVGCIDRWLLGSCSYDECFTSGCPTCKKRPVDPLSSSKDGTALNHKEEIETESHARSSFASNNDGSVPSWAFAKLGSQMAQSMSG